MEVASISHISRDSATKLVHHEKAGEQLKWPTINGATQNFLDEEVLKGDGLEGPFITWGPK